MSGILFEAPLKNGLERKVHEQLVQNGVPLPYEKVKLAYTVPARDAKYIPDWVDEERNIIIEAKGRFGHFRSDSAGAQERQKMILVKELYPDWEIWIIFQDVRKPIYKGSKTTYAMWADTHGFKYSDKGVVPAELIAKLKANTKRSKKRT